MNLLDNIRLYLPKYLSEESTKILLQNIGGFPNNISHSLYTKNLNADIIFQGDALLSMPIINLPETEIKSAPALILSNTCDIDLANKRPIASQICYTPIFQLNKYIEMLKRNNKYSKKEYLSQHLEKLKKQYITQMIYLPIGVGLNYEGVVFLDRIVNCQNNHILRNDLSEKRLFSLSNYGYYLLLTKLSIHFSRLQEKIDRDMGEIS